MNGAEIISNFETYVDDGTELSDTQELDLLNKVYTDVWTDRPWYFSVKAFSGAVSGTTIALSSDFAYVCSQNIIEEIDNKIVWIGTTYYIIVPYSDRYLYSSRAGFCWVDYSASTLTFSTSVSGTVTYDYVYFPAALTLITSPAFPVSFHPVLYHLMAVDDYAIQQFDKARSYAPENQAKADHWLTKLRYYDAQVKGLS